MRNWITKIFIFLSALLILFAINESIGRIGDLQLAKDRPDLFEADSFHIHYANNAVTMYIHVIAGLLFLLSGVHQLIPTIRNNSLFRHRIIGKIFLISSFIVSISAIYIALFIPYGDWLESVTNLIFGIYILYATVKAYTTIRSRLVIQHSNWVKRVFFVSLSIATIRIIMILNMMMTNESVQQVMGRSFLIGFLIHVVLIEWWIKRSAQ